MEYTMKAHQTLYAGVVFRSRLEATWAAMFDLLGWVWDYEPFDLDGWVPDFRIRGKYREVLVEVKPTAAMAEHVTYRVLKAAGPDACVLVVTSGPVPQADPVLRGMGFVPQLGAVSAPYNRSQGRLWAVMSLKEIDGAAVHDCHIDGEKYLGFYTGAQLDSMADGYDERIGVGHYPDLMTLWHQASNLTRKHYR